MTHQGDEAAARDAEAARPPEHRHPERVHPRGEVPLGADGAAARELGGGRDEREDDLEQLGLLR